MNSRRPMKFCLSHRQHAAHADHAGADQFSTSAPYASDFDHKLPRRSRERGNEGSWTTRRLPFGLGAAMLLLPDPCLAAAGGLPWDQTLLALQSILVGPVAHAAIGSLLSPRASCMRSDARNKLCVSQRPVSAVVWRSARSDC